MASEGTRGGLVWGGGGGGGGLVHQLMGWPCNSTTVGIAGTSTAGGGGGGGALAAGKGGGGGAGRPTRSTAEGTGTSTGVTMYNSRLAGCCFSSSNHTETKFWSNQYNELTIT